MVNEAQKGYDNSQKYRAGGQDVKEEATNVATGEEIMDELSDDNTGSSIVESVTDEKITETGEESGSNIVESITEENVEEEKVSREDQTWEDKLNDYKSEFKDEETLKRYEEDPIAFVEEDIAGWESEEDSDEKTQVGSIIKSFVISYPSGKLNEISWPFKINSQSITFLIPFIY